MGRPLALKKLAQDGDRGFIGVVPRALRSLVQGYDWPSVHRRTSLGTTRRDPVRTPAFGRSSLAIGPPRTASPDCLLGGSQQSRASRRDQSSGNAVSAIQMAIKLGLRKRRLLTPWTRKPTQDAFNGPQGRTGQLRTAAGTGSPDANGTIQSLYVAAP
jgi:hypothetical protein